jgi:DNA polymerase-3 subunit epsilon
MLKLWLKRRYYRQMDNSALKRLWSNPLPKKGLDWQSAKFLVCDAEMSSLDVGNGELLSVGWVEINNGCINLNSARHYLLKNKNSVGDSATIHHLRDCEFEQALEPTKVLELFLQACSGRTLVFHNAQLDLSYINKVCRHQFGAPLLMPIVDTLLQEQALLTRHDTPIKTDDLRLQSCRSRYNLPDYPAHNALVDALATAELLLAHANKRAGNGKLPLEKLLQ